MGNNSYEEAMDVDKRNLTEVEVPSLLMGDEGDVEVLDDDIRKALENASTYYIPLNPVGTLVCTDCRKSIAPKSLIIAQARKTA